MATLNELFPAKPPVIAPVAPSPLGGTKPSPLMVSPHPAQTSGSAYGQLQQLPQNLVDQILFSRATGQYNPDLAAALGPLFSQYMNAYGAGGQFYDANPQIGLMQYGAGGQPIGINGMDAGTFSNYVPQLGQMNYNTQGSPVAGGGNMPPPAAQAAPAPVAQPAPQPAVPQSGGGYSGAAGLPPPAGMATPLPKPAVAPIAGIGHSDPFGGMPGGIQLGSPPVTSAPGAMAGGGGTPLPQPYTGGTGPQMPKPTPQMWQPQVQSSLPTGGYTSPGTPLAGQQRTPLGRRYIPGGY